MEKTQNIHFSAVFVKKNVAKIFKTFKSLRKNKKNLKKIKKMKIPKWSTRVSQNPPCAPVTCS